MNKYFEMLGDHASVQLYCVSDERPKAVCGKGKENFTKRCCMQCQKQQSGFRDTQSDSINKVKHKTNSEDRESCSRFFCLLCKGSFDVNLYM